jgi:Na+-translocating ferredoxin:NAD+ oxidoreductase RnfG subunit
MALHPNHWVWLPVAAISVPAYAASYLTAEQAQQAIFPGAKMAPAFVKLSDEQIKSIAEKSGAEVHAKEVKAWKVAGGGWFILDAVIGKHEAIDYAVGLDSSGRVLQVEILEYRESYGFEVRNPKWRKQFAGKTAADPVKLDRDIRNISGATLSCRHVADGVRRILATYAVALK